MPNQRFVKHTSSSYHIACYHFFSWLVQDSPNVPKLLLNDPSPRVPKRLPRALPSQQNIRKYKHDVKTCTTNNGIYRLYLLTCTQGPWSEVQSQRSQLKGPGFKIGLAGTRRVCDWTQHNTSQYQNNATQYKTKQWDTKKYDTIQYDAIQDAS